MKSWKTSLAGIIVAVGGMMQTHTDPKLQAYGQTIMAIAGSLGLVACRDNDKSSKNVGAK